ncbi:unnamed protein product [Pleuronectes platessa]|uniref:Uncharacterized protein n=1 Tax=Pleuronectes platessa TaxID=8262 RepID=A0A9N7VM99_PLEPL|nr:unnamed protein product [Pleuronectes platessa]
MSLLRLLAPAPPLTCPLRRFVSPVENLLLNSSHPRDESAVSSPLGSPYSPYELIKNAARWDWLQLPPTTTTTTTTLTLNRQSTLLVTYVFQWLYWSSLRQLEAWSAGFSVNVDLPPTEVQPGPEGEEQRVPTK